MRSFWFAINTESEGTSSSSLWLVGSSISMIRRQGGIEFGGLGAEYAGYVTDPAIAREVLQELMEEVKSVGIFINFIVRFPEQYYNTIDTYRSGVDPG